jgi:hypothetical protein
MCLADIMRDIGVGEMNAKDYMAIACHQYKKWTKHEQTKNGFKCWHTGYDMANKKEYHYCDTQLVYLEKKLTPYLQSGQEIVIIERENLTSGRTITLNCFIKDGDHIYDYDLGYLQLVLYFMGWDARGYFYKPKYRLIHHQKIVDVMTFHLLTHKNLRLKVLTGGLQEKE